MERCPAPTRCSLRSALSSRTSGHMSLITMVLHPWGHREPQMPQIGAFLYKSPFSTCLCILPALGALAEGSSEGTRPALEEKVNTIPSPEHRSSSGQPLTWRSILSANEPQSQMA